MCEEMWSREKFKRIELGGKRKGLKECEDKELNHRDHRELHRGQRGDAQPLNTGDRFQVENVEGFKRSLKRKHCDNITYIIYWTQLAGN